MILLPDLGQTTSEAKVLRWWKQPGDRVLRGEPLLAVETDKVDMDVESFVDGYLRQALVESGAVASALQPIAILTDTPDEKYADAPAPSGDVPQRIAASPAAKSLARELGLDLGAIRGSGPDGLIVRKDLKPFTREREAVDERAISAMAAVATSAKRDVPHFYVTVDVDAARADSWRDEWNAGHPELHASFNDVFVRCAARALHDTPRLNTHLQNGAYTRRSSPDLLVVVAQDAGLALVEIPDPRAAPWEDFLRSMRTAVGKPARSVPSPAGSASRPLLALSNLGMYGVKEFAAIIPPGCTAVLAIGAVRHAPVVRHGCLVAGRISTLTLSADHRIVDGVTAARFLERMQHHLDSL
jgi:pyruvate dehydrogenase E2 component (dihydrolipoamide acetyltransferase)